MIVLILAACGFLTSVSAGPICTVEEGNGIFRSKILPLFQNHELFSCNQCHTASFQFFERENPCQILACLESQKSFNPVQPDSSKLLWRIGRALSVTQGAGQAIVQNEYDAFRDWFRWAAECGSAACGETSNPCNSHWEVRPPLAKGFAGGPGCTDSALISAFALKVMPYARSKCAACHIPNAPQGDSATPAWLYPSDTNAFYAAQQTLFAVVDSGLVNTAAPESSLLLLKPLSPALGGVQHGGHGKVVIQSKDEPIYVDFLSWLQMYAACKNDIGVEAAAPRSGNSLSVIPNPFHGSARVIFPAGILTGRISVYDLAGREIVQSSSTMGGKASLDLRGYPPGLYVLRAVAGRSIFHQTLVHW